MNPILRLLFGLIILLLPSTSISAQSLLDLLEEEEEPITNYTYATFKSTRIINGHSIETNAKNQLQFVIAHRFGQLNSGWRDLFGIDNATVRFSLDYGITDWLNVGIGRSNFQKIYDGYLKAKVLRQSSGAKSFPFTMTLVSGIQMETTVFAEPDRENFFSSRLSYVQQVLIARKFTDGFSMQLSPSLVHRNLVDSIADANDVFSLGIGARQKITPSIAITAEYFYVFPNQISSPVQGEQVQNALSLGIDLETGGHVFQLHVTNSRGMAEKLFIAETVGDVLDGDIHFGFNISRVFALGKR
jgi:opacity protein-like surface antigen